MTHIKGGKKEKKREVKISLVPGRNKSPIPKRGGGRGGSYRTFFPGGELEKEGKCRFFPDWGKREWCTSLVLTEEKKREKRCMALGERGRGRTSSERKVHSSRRKGKPLLGGGEGGENHVFREEGKAEGRRNLRVLLISIQEKKWFYSRRRKGDGNWLSLKQGQGGGNESERSG